MKWLTLASLLLIGQFSYSDDQSSTSSSLQFSQEAIEANPQGFVPLIGVGGGYTDSDHTQSLSTEGTPGTMKLLGSWYLKSPFVMDIGYGFNSQSFSQGSALASSINNAAGELAFRYRFDSRWQLGAIFDQFFGQGPNYQAEQADAQFVGVQVLKEFNLAPAWIARLGGRVMSLTNNTGNQTNMYMIDLQFGWVPSSYKASVKAAEQEKQKQQIEEVAAAETARPVASMEPQPILKELSLATIASAGVYNFNNGRTVVAKGDQDKLSALAKTLADNKDLYQGIEVRGYADATGGATLNKQISQERADSVKTILQNNGLRDVPIVAKGEGTHGAVGGASAEDRRAEIIFTGVKDQDALKKALSDIQ
jgi:outer membrane protein OmpA-like peptidoglycan-associated protein